MSALETERRFFTALTQAEVPALEEILAPDLSMVALNGSVLDRASLTGAIGSGYLKFQEIRVLEAAERFYLPLAVIVGRTEMSGSVGGTPFRASSRYTHVYTPDDERWRLVIAQGAPIAPPIAPE